MKKDGCVFFGSSRVDERELQLSQGRASVANDVIVNDPSLEESQQKPEGEEKRNFVIKYKLDRGGYYLKDLGEGAGTFVRVDKPLIVSTGFLISFGDSHMVLDTITDPVTDEQQI